jgi:membrane-associated phospholipid phosphatase
MDLTSLIAGSARRVVMRSSWLVGLLAILLCHAAGAAEPLSSSQRDVEKAGSVVRWAIPATALLATWLADPVRSDESGDAQARSDYDLLNMGGSPRHDLALAVGRSWLLTGALKVTVDEARPDGGTHSFPSGHASMAFAGAEFLRKQYGWQWGAPAYVAAGFVGWSRVEARRHYTHDVLAGAMIGMLANHDWREWRTSAGRLSLAPVPLSAGAHAAPGLQLTLVY